MARFFIDHPVFAWVIAILITLAGVLSISRLSIEAYPDIAPPQIQVSANYPGADAEVVEHTVTQIIEQSLTGIDHLLYFTSSSNSKGNANVTLTFDTGTDSDTAVVQKHIQADSMQGTQWLVTGGLTDGDRIIATSVDQVHPGMKVKVRPDHAPGS